MDFPIKRRFAALAQPFLLLATTSSLWAQTTPPIPSDPSSAYDQSVTLPPDPKATDHYLVPDVPSKPRWISHESKYFSYRLGIIALVDYDSFWQDSNSLTQVGHQRDQWDLRAERITLGGNFGSLLPITYFLSLEYEGFDRPPDAKGWAMTDVSLTTRLGRRQNGFITVGKTKETFCYEMVGDAANLPQMERLLNPFFTSRNVGVKYSNNFAHNRIFVSAGWFNDWWVKGDPYAGSSNHYTARLALLPVMSTDGSSFLHLGFATRWIGASNGQLQFTARPESNVTTSYADTGKFPAQSSINYGFEGLANSGPVSFLAEYIYTTTNAPAVGNPNFYGTYLTGSWVITGEHRPYDPSVGYARRIIPEHRYGAWEIVGRIGRVDLTNKAIQGGALNAYSANVSWWPDRRYRISMGYGSYPLYRSGIVGTTTQFHGRFQWVF